jgi:alkanesulfonate monooxygenase SsuD/methylene tetrahydromethanopterin reductase-like flavin-dependent oxidoreductase (luciferase family)
MREQVSALRDYAAEHGPGWKEKLRKDWANPTSHPLLYPLRNSHGPIWLAGFEFPA